MSDISPRHASDDELLDLAYGLDPQGAASPVLEHAETCSRCESRFQQMVADRERGLSRWAQQGYAAGGRIRPWVSGNVVRVVGTLAAVVALASAYLLTRPSLELEPLWLAEPGSTLVLRSQDPAASDQLAAGLKAYADKDLDRAVEFLEGEQTSAGRELVRRIYLGSSLVLQGRAARGLKVLEPVDAASLPSPWRDQVRWTRAVAFQQLGRTAEARSRLQDLAGEDTPLGRRAREALEQ